MSRTPDAKMRRHIYSAARGAAHTVIPGSAHHSAVHAVLQWLDDTDADPPPNTERVRIMVDVPITGLGAVVPREGERCPPGWRRSVVVADVPLPEPVAEIVGTVEVP